MAHTFTEATDGRYKFSSLWTDAIRSDTYLRTQI